MDVSIEHHVDEHDEEDERICPCPVRDELLHEAAADPAVPGAIEELDDSQEEEQRLKRERDGPTSRDRRASARGL